MQETPSHLTGEIYQKSLDSKWKNKRMRLYQTEKYLHSQGSNQPNEETNNRLGEII